jgi:probable HAF family extracellular repeat protein
MCTTRILALCTAVAFVASCQDATQPNTDTDGAARVSSTPTVTIIDLGVLPGGNFSTATAINARGDIVGRATTASGEEHAALWRNGVITDLGTLGGTYSHATGINAAGQVVGRSTTSSGVEYGFIWERGTMRSLGAPPGEAYTVALGINPAGVIVGAGEWGLLTWERGVAAPLPFPDGTSQCSGGGIDNAGRVVGYCSMETGYTRSFIWERGVPLDLGLVGSGDVVVGGISPTGTATGFFSTEDGARPFIWEHGTLIELATLGADPSFGGGGINAAGSIAGAIYGGNFNLHAAVWHHGATIDLGTLPGGTDSGASGINAAGQIVGQSNTATGETHAVLWTLK